MTEGQRPWTARVWGDTGGQDRDKKFQLLAAAGQPADVDWMDQANIGPFREQGLLRPLDPLIKRDRYALDDFYPMAQKIYQFRGRRSATRTRPGSWSKS